eukprot:6237548-Prymnesium_polylepis.2
MSLGPRNRAAAACVSVVSEGRARLLHRRRFTAPRNWPRARRVRSRSRERVGSERDVSHRAACCMSRCGACA